MYLFTISAHLGPDYEILSQALALLRALRLDLPDWRRTLDRMQSTGGGDAYDNHAFGTIKFFIEELGWTSVKRAAECAVAHMGLYPDASSWDSAVTRCRDIWRKYKAGQFLPLGDWVEQNGIIVRPRVDNLREDETREIIDPYDLQPLPAGGKRVEDTAYWRNMVALGLVEILQDR